MRWLVAALLAAPARAFVAPAARAPSQNSAPRAAAAACQPRRPGAAATTQLVAELENAVPIDKSGWFGGIVQAMETVITFLHDVVGSYGVAIVLFTLILKAATFPLNKAQIESTTKMQALQPAIKKIQATYAADPDKMNMMMAQLYQENELNPLAGCLPSLLQIPVFIALYRALLSLAREDLLEESFLWIPNLEGPVFGAQNADWLFKFDNWNGAVPPLGWADTAAYLALPVLLVVAQSVSTQLLQPPGQSDDPNAPGNNAVLKFLPVMVGFFSLNVPAGLTIYWFCNNLITTASTLYIRGTVEANPVTMGGASAAPPAPKKLKKKKKAKAGPAFEDLVAAAPKAPAPPAPAPPVVADAAGVVDVVAETVVDAAPAAAVVDVAPAAAAAAAPAAAAPEGEEGLSKSAAKKKARARRRSRDGARSPASEVSGAATRQHPVAGICYGRARDPRRRSEGGGNT